MMSFEAVGIYTLEGDFWAYGIKGPNKLQSPNVYFAGEEGQLNDRLNELNAGQDIRSTWPHPQDPDVQELLNDPNFHPIEYTETKVLDKENSYLVYFDEMYTEDGKYDERSGDIDESRSVLRYKKAKIPTRPSDMKLRLQDAMEAVARNRLASQD